MGLDANTVIWLGVKVGSRDELGDLLREFAEEESEKYEHLMAEGEVNFFGSKLKIFKHADEPIGLGIELVDRGWRESPVELDLSNLSSQIPILTSRIRFLFANMKITAEPKVWLATVLP